MVPLRIPLAERDDYTRVNRRDVPANADAPLGVQAAFALAAAALVFEEVDRAGGVGPAEEGIGDELPVTTRTGAVSARCSAAARNGRAGVTAPRTVTRAGPFLRASAISRSSSRAGLLAEGRTAPPPGRKRAS
jgi:hypothetical protein